MTVKISKIILNPSRTIGLENYSSVKLSAGIEIVFDTPVDIDSKELQTNLDGAREFIRNEFKKQYGSFLPKKREGK